jgi:hypothetical protein
MSFPLMGETPQIPTFTSVGFRTYAASDHSALSGGVEGGSYEGPTEVKGGVWAPKKEFSYES